MNNDSNYKNRAPTSRSHGDSHRGSDSHDIARILSDPKTWDPAHTGRSRAAGYTDASNDLRLTDGSRVAVVGGGPAGSLFSFFLLKTLALVDTKIVLDIYEPRRFEHRGPAGCNHCGGIVSESLVQILATEGILLPGEVVQRGIDSYMLHMDVGSVRIDTPLHEKRIAAVYRGNGPRESQPTMTVGFDRYLLDLAVENGATVQRKLVTDVKWLDARPCVVCADGAETPYDLLVVASGVNSQMTNVIEHLGLGYKAPSAVMTFISEFHMGQRTIEQHLGTSMHVFLLDLPRLEFAAMIPKGDFVTVCMLGHDIDEGLVNAFLNSPEVRRCFPGAIVPASVCHCFPRINVRCARKPFADRVVFIGDSGATRLYKDGIGAAYRTSKAAAMTAALHGISEQAFSQHYWSACRAINYDNMIGRFVFGVCHLIQKLRFSRRAVLRMTSHEQMRSGNKRLMSSVLWDVFTGSAPYREVLLRTFHPAFIGGLAWNLLAGNVPSSKAKNIRRGHDDRTSRQDISSG
jgi:flavin-dependent dehydrogenase